MTTDARQIKAILGGDVEQDAERAAARLAERAAAEGLVEVSYASFDSPLGTGQLAATSRGIVSIGLPGIDRDAFLEALSAEVSPRMLELPARVDVARRELEEYFERRAARLRPAARLAPGALARSRAASCARPRRSRSGSPRPTGRSRRGPAAPARIAPRAPSSATTRSRSSSRATGCSARAASSASTAAGRR